MFVLPAAYLPDVHWFACALQQGEAVVGLAHRYDKQTPLSRSLIKGANGRLQLCVQVTHSSRHQPVETATLSMREGWHRLHLRSLQSAYGRCAYFAHYGPALLAHYTAPPASLAGFNLALIQHLCQCVQLPCRIEPAATPGMPWPTYHIPEYYQPFGAFDPALSVVDILMNEGPATRQLLRQATPVEND